MSYNLDQYFITHPHEYDPKRLYSQNNADWQYRVDHDRMRKERLARLREQAFGAAGQDGVIAG